MPDSNYMIKRCSPFFLVTILLFAACKPREIAKVPSSQAVKAESPIVAPRKTIEKPQFPYRPSETKHFDLIHTKLEVDFDWEKERMNGKAWLKMKPWFGVESEVVLDAKGFLLNKVGIIEQGNFKPLKYNYENNEKLSIQLGQAYTSKDTIVLYIDYVARPSELEKLVSKEAADDQGLYFINPKGEEIGKPKQIWTQGESHGSPAWFPTFDTPNQKCTQEIAITVADSFKTLSNGLLVESKKNANGSRTDYWKMSLPHSPYLFMMAIGNFSIVKDSWRGKEVNYYVEPAYEQYARLIFGLTPEMLEFFSNKLGVDYPWEKYSQVVVRDFVSGAMENTSATTHFGGLQHTARQHIDRSHEDIISHELFHQWFGDLVTCESWANLTLNEGFATYGEFLWIDHKYGSEEAMLHLMENRNSYLRESKRKLEPLIRYHNEDANSMFDAHSYQKGGQVLHMLRKEIGDEAFFLGLKKYLNDNAYDDVEVHKLRLAFEDVTGRDLSIFFNQWFLSAGHPQIKISYAQVDGKTQVTIRQVQDFSNSTIYEFPISFEISANGKSYQKQFYIKDSLEILTIEEKSPTYIFFNSTGDLLCEIISDERSQESWKRQLQKANNYYGQSEACAKLAFDQFEAQDMQILEQLSRNKFWGSRQLAMESAAQISDSLLPQFYPAIVKGLSDEKSFVAVSTINLIAAKSQAVNTLLESNQRQTLITSLSKASNDSSYAVSNGALRTLVLLDSAAALARAEELRQLNDQYNITAIAYVYMELGSPKAMRYIRSVVQNPSTEPGVKSALFRGFGEYLLERPEAEKAEGRSLLMEVLEGNEPWWLHFSVIQALTRSGSDPEVKEFLKKQLEKEDNDYIKGMIERYLKTE